MASNCGLLCAYYLPAGSDALTDQQWLAELDGLESDVKLIAAGADLRRRGDGGGAVEVGPSTPEDCAASALRAAPRDRAWLRVLGSPAHEGAHDEPASAGGSKGPRLRDEESSSVGRRRRRSTRAPAPRHT